MFIVMDLFIYEEFPTYREAELYCVNHGIDCDNIYSE